MMTLGRSQKWCVMGLFRRRGLFLSVGACILLVFFMTPQLVFADNAPDPVIVSANVGDFNVANPGITQPVIRLTIAPSAANANHITDLIFNGNGAVDGTNLAFGSGPGEINAVQVYVDDDGDGKWDPSEDILLDSPGFVFSTANQFVNTAPITLQLSDGVGTGRIDLIAPADRVTLFVVYTYGSGIVVGGPTTAGFQLTGVTWVGSAGGDGYNISTTDPAVAPATVAGDATATDVNQVTIVAPTDRLSKPTESFPAILVAGQKNPVHFIELKNIDNNNAIDILDFTVQNLQGNNSFGPLDSHVNGVSIFKDESPVGVFDADTDKEIGSFQFAAINGAPQLIQLTTPLSLSGEASQDFIVVYDVGDAVNFSGGALTDDIQYDLTNITWFQNQVQSTFDPSVTNQSFEISGLTITADQLPVNNVADFIAPGKPDIPVLHFTITPDEDGFEFDSLIINNSAPSPGNFDNVTMISTTTTVDGVTTTTETIQEDVSGNVVIDNEGINRVRLWRDAGVAGFQITDTIIHTFTNDRTESTAANTSLLTNSSQVTFTDLDETITAAAVGNYFITYELTASTNITSDSVVNAQIPINGISGIGTTLGLTMTNFTEQPAASATLPIAGLTFSTDIDTLKSITPTSLVIGPGMQSVPIFQFELTAHQRVVTLNSFIINNTGTVPFRSTLTDTNGVTGVHIFRDKLTNLNGSFDGPTLDDLVASGDPAAAGIVSTPTSITLDRLVTAVPTLNIAESVTYYVVYDIGSGVQTSTDVSANVSSFVNGNLELVTANIGLTDIDLSGVLPTIVTPDARVNIIRIEAIVNSVTEIGPTINTVQGQIDVPMLAINLLVSEQIPSASFTIRNPSAQFSANSSGISRVKLYLDKLNEGTPGEIDSTDILLGNTSVFTGSTDAVISGFLLPKSTNLNLIVAYDIGQQASTGGAYVTAQLAGISGGSSAVQVGGNFPMPKTINFPLSVVASGISVPGLTSDVSSVSNASDPFNVVISVRNDVAANVTIHNIQPRFYINGISGQDVSYEYQVTKADTNPVLVNANDTTTFSFVVNPSGVFTEGNVIIDGFVDYHIGEVAEDFYAILPRHSLKQRFKDETNQWNTVSPINPLLSVESTNADFDFIIPEYISEVQIESKGIFRPWETGYPVPQNSRFKIVFNSKGEFIDSNSIQLSLNNEPIPNERNLITVTNSFSYDQEQGELILQTLGTSNATISITVNDTAGFSLPQALYNFTMSTDLTVTDFLPFPNPYSPSVSSVLRLGFGLTKDAVVQIDVYDSVGRKVATPLPLTQKSLGYVLVDWNTAGSFSGNTIASGIYFIRLSATDSDNNIITDVTKLAVY